MTYSIELPDGSRVQPGHGEPALGTVKVTAAAFAGQEADPGGVCAAELAAELFGATVNAGDTLRLYRDETLLGTFFAEKPTVSPGRLQITAYDAVTKLDRDLTDWLEGLTWPVTLSDLAQMVCAACGLTLTGDLENADWSISQFQARGITGRQLMQWVCQAGCRFCTAQPDGSLRLSWLTQTDTALEATGETFYFSGMTRADYTVPTPDGVQIALTDSDVGVVSKDGAQNLLTIRGNYLLCGCENKHARAIAEQLAPAYTPCVLETTAAIAPGQLFTVDGATVLAMTVEECAGRCRVTCTGSASRTAASAVCQSSYKAMSGRVMELSLDLQGLRTRMVQHDGELEKYSRLTQDVDNVTARVGQLEDDTDTRFSQLELRSEGVELTVGQLSGQLDQKADSQDLDSLSQHFLFDTEGLTISDSATGMSILVSQEEVAFRDGTVITPTGLTTTNLQVDSHFKLGGFAFLPRSSGNLSIRYTG